MPKRFHQDIESTIDEVLDWLEDTPHAETEDMKAKQNEVQQIVNPILQNVYQNSGPTGGEYNDGDFDYDDL